MNILLLAHERSLGGASKSLVTLAEELRERGHYVLVVVPFKRGQVYAKLKELQIPVYNIFYGWWMMPSYWNPLLKVLFWVLYMTEPIPVARIAKAAKKNHIQIIHSNSSTIDIGARVAKKAGLPHIWHFREFGDADYQLEFLKGRKKSCQFVQNSESHVIFISKALRRYYEQEISDDISHVVYNGISDDFLSEKDYIEAKEKVIFLISGNLHRNKGQDTALEAGKLLAENGNIDFELWIAGKASAMSDSKKYEMELREYAGKYLSSNCKFLGFVSDMKKLRQQTDVELVCSGKEAFGRVTIEAMMAGNPVIGTDTGANPELIKDKVAGRLFYKGNAADLADKMRWFMEDRQNISKCGKAAYSFAKEQFLSCRNTEAVEEIYKSYCKAQQK